MLNVEDAFKIFFISGSLWIMSWTLLMMGSSSCAGRDVCGNKYCLTGILEKYLIIPYILSKIGLIATIVTGSFWLYKYIGI